MNTRYRSRLQQRSRQSGSTAGAVKPVYATVSSHMVNPAGPANGFRSSALIDMVMKNRGTAHLKAIRRDKKYFYSRLQAHTDSKTGQPIN